MDAFVTRKRPRLEPTPAEDDSTEIKLALLASLHPHINHDVLLEALLVADGSVTDAAETLAQQVASPWKKQKTRAAGYHQSSLSSLRISPSSPSVGSVRPLTKRGRTLHLFDPKDVEAYTPCSIIHNFLPSGQADDLLRELLDQAPTYGRLEFKLFDRVVKSPHSFCFYVNSLAEVETQKTEYIYDGKPVDDVRQCTPEMLKARIPIEEAVNREIQRRIRDFYPNGKKLKYQSPEPWKANAAFVNCYDGPQESVGYHTDQLTYLGPRAVIGSLSLGVEREFRVRKMVVEDDEHRKDDGSLADAQGQISIHLPHNSLLIMHAEMQEEWKHAIAPAQAIDPHPLAQNKRLNITYRCYKEKMHPKYTPRCKCGVPTVLRCVTKSKDNRGKYMWMCHAGYVPGQDGCSFFQWAEFDDDGNPRWRTTPGEEKKVE
ncbi:hypothetical protein M011DRAFT_528819 [Sporormia fimetaria CBS 119925]|uniref:Uncharacterized protein n=1 Tax=Sporormia fimetaria CBS 119925 TaxID=1340428 RepID=A0A6A6V2B1_9PLEO|nr:hypothetical protein M011DRAFT_528819 [Sporormia fimetaria CBS 119925]